MMDKKTQCSKIIEILERDGIIDNFAAIQGKITYRLAARINDLKRQGWQFNCFKGDGNQSKNYFYQVVSKPSRDPFGATHLLSVR